MLPGFRGISNLFHFLSNLLCHFLALSWLDLASYLNNDTEALRFDFTSTSAKFMISSTLSSSPPTTKENDPVLPPLPLPGLKTPSPPRCQESFSSPSVGQNREVWQGGLRCLPERSVFYVLTWMVASMIYVVIVLLARSCLFCNPMDYSLPGSTIHGIS